MSKFQTVIQLLRQVFLNYVWVYRVNPIDNDGFCIENKKKFVSF
jgi:hypothetical protein